MRKQIEIRLVQLQAEYQSGQKLVAEPEAKLGKLRQTLLRIGGAFQVLEETLRIEGDQSEVAVTEEDAG
jgi:hypothetical protein